MAKEKRYMAEAEAAAHYKENAAGNMRYILAKIPVATPKELAVIASFIRGLGVKGWAEQEVTV
jgi:hypothetical protein